MAKSKRVVIVGSGAREHALAAAMVSGGHQAIVAPGNAGTEAVARNVAIGTDDVPGLVDLAVSESADLVIVGPELPLTLGLVDALAARGILAFGPTKAAARLEGSKAFMKRFCKRHGIPTASFEVFEDPDAADRHVRDASTPLVVKADGLAAGKGVVVSESAAEASLAVDRIMRQREFGDAGREVVLEERLEGEEASFHVVCDGVRGVALAAAQDHKRVGDADRGPNTGGMGAYTPAPVVTQAVHERVMREIVEPTLAGMAAEGAPLRGVLFVGLMIDRGIPKVLEYNVRFGDPEATVLVPTYGGDWFDLLESAARGDLSRTARAAASQPTRAALSIVMAAAGYPGKPRTGDRIEGLATHLPPGAFIFHAGTSRTAPGPRPGSTSTGEPTDANRTGAREAPVFTSGGRVLAVGASASTLEAAARVAYDVVAQIRWEGEHHRSDIGRRGLARGREA